MRPRHFSAPACPGASAATGFAASPASGRYSENPTSRSSRLAGLAGTSCIAVLLAFALLFTWQVVRPSLSPSPRPLVVEFQPLAAPPDPVRELPPGPVQVERQDHKPQPVRDIPPPQIVLGQTPATPPVTPKSPDLADPGPPVPQTTAPKSIAAPTADRLSSEAHPDWEASVLAHLERFRRYPSRARAMRQQGVVYVRFRMDRSGAVLSSGIVRKSGFFTLDQAALDTLHRAQPLPTIPPGRPDIVEFTMPIQFKLD
ncbi:energy transducer TonB [Novosphingobium sp.]|uniref:energy transducer TonB n=1 Tax=Novosphingobium sp. TaxID=1874826 RepID=UPI0028A5D47E|nr:energy transducer TonB [Novosphingobium sp.]